MDKPIDGEIFGPDDKRAEGRVKRDFWSVVKKAARVIPFIDEVVAAYFCAMDPQTPARVRLVLLGALAYFVIPLDTIPDFILAFGFTDDATVLTMAIATVSGYITPAHRKAAKDSLKDQT